MPKSLVLVLFSERQVFLYYITPRRIELGSGTPLRTELFRPFLLLQRQIHEGPNCPIPLPTPIALKIDLQNHQVASNSTSVHKVLSSFINWGSPALSNSDRMFWEDNSRCPFDVTRGASSSSKTCFVLAKMFSHGGDLFPGLDLPFGDPFKIVGHFIIFQSHLGERAGELVNGAMMDSPRMEEGSDELEAEAMADSPKPETTPQRVRILIAEEVPNVNGDVKDEGGMGSPNVGESHKLVDEGNGEVAREEVERDVEETSVLSSHVRGVSCEGVGGDMIRSSRVRTLEENGTKDTRVVGGAVVDEGVIGENTLLDEGILKEEGEPMLGGVAMLWPTEEEIVTLELAIEAVGEMRELPVVVADVVGVGSPV
eukprot:Gb_16120 [translate_table: standard]